MAETKETRSSAGIAAFEHLTGPDRGRSLWLNGPELEILLDPNRQLHARSDGVRGPTETAIARVKCDDDRCYEIWSLEARPLWVNGILTTNCQLNNRDIIEFGDVGPLSRFRVYDNKATAHKSFGELLKDEFTYLHISRQPVFRRLYRAMGSFCKRLMGETTILFRVGVLAALAVLAGLTIQQNRVNTHLQEQIQIGASQIEGFARALTRAQADALSPGDLRGLREELENRLTVTSERLGTLERRSDAIARVIASANSSVFFIQGAYGFREISGGRYLRHIVDDTGTKLITPFGQPMLSVEGQGPIAERQFTGTGFAVGDDGVVVTNRHIALPWENDATAVAFVSQGLEPVMIKQLVYRRGQAEPSSVTLLGVSDEADLALLRQQDENETTSGLIFADALPAPGAEVIVMGYPTGLRSMLMQSGKEFIEELQKANDTDFWNVAKRLAVKGFIAPLSSRGIVSQITKNTIVYDAETTHGGSGGPVLNIKGEVIAVNSAILPDYGGSNLGVPVGYVRNLLQKVAEN